MPTGQGVHTSEEADPTSTPPLPGGHMVQAVDPGAGAYEPERQGAQEEAEMAPGSGLARPAGQSVQKEGEDAPMDKP